MSCPINTPAGAGVEPQYAFTRAAEPLQLPPEFEVGAETCNPCHIAVRHQAVLRERAIPFAVAARAGLRSIQNIHGSKDWAKRNKIAWEFKGCRAPRTGGLLIPYHEYLDGTVPFRIRTDETSYAEPGPVDGANHGETTVEVPRYLIPAGTKVGPYFPPEILKIAANTSEPIWICEAPLKALALTAHGYPAIGMGGVCAGAHDSAALKDTGEVLAHPEIRRIDWRSRTAVIAYDAGLANNPMVAMGAARVWRVLQGLGAIVQVLPVPFATMTSEDLERGIFFGDDDQGPDDLLYRKGLEGLLVRTYSADPVSRVTEAVAGLGPEGRAHACADLLSELFFTATLAEMTIAQRQTVAAASKKSMGIRAIDEAVSLFQGRMAEKARKDAASEYKVEDGCLTVGDTRLANFHARIVAEVLRDDGDTRVRHFKVEGELGNGSRLPAATIKASEFDDLKWVATEWGSAAVVAAGRAVTAHVAVGIKTLSRAGDATVAEFTTYTHTGWRDVNGQQVFLLPGGGIGASGHVQLDVELDGLRGYACPTLSGDALGDVRHALSVLDVADRSTTVPMMGMAILAPLATALGGIDFMLWVRGESGGLKSSLAALMQSFFGPCAHNSLPGTWFSTANAIEAQAAITKDCLDVIDNLTPPQSEREKAEQSAKVLRLIQSIGDGQSRARCLTSGELRVHRRPRGAVMATAELLPPGNESTLARVLVVERPKPIQVDDGAGGSRKISSDVAYDLLSSLQDEGSLRRLGSAMGHYLSWLARTPEALQEATARHRAARQEMTGTHLRTPAMLAMLLAGWRTFLDFAAEAGLETSTVDRLSGEIRATLVALGAAQPEPVHRRATDEFIYALRSMLRRSIVGLQTMKDLDLAPRPAVDGQPHVPLIGWQDGARVLLDPEATYREVTRYLGARWTHAEGEFRRQLRHASVEVDGPDETTLEVPVILTHGEGTHLGLKVRGFGGPMERPRLWAFDARVLVASPEATCGEVEQPTDEELFAGMLN